MDGRVREQPFGHLVGPGGGLVGVVGLDVDLEPVGRPERGEFEPEALECPFGRLGLGIEHAPLQADRHGRGELGHRGEVRGRV